MSTMGIAIRACIEEDQTRWVYFAVIKNSKSKTMFKIVLKLKKGFLYPSLVGTYFQGTQPHWEAAMGYKNNELGKKLAIAAAKEALRSITEDCKGMSLVPEIEEE